MNGGFVGIANDFLFRSDISPAAKGIFCYMAAKPAGWKFSAYRMAEELGCGERHVKTCMRELKESKAIESSKRNSDGTFDYFFSCMPSVRNAPERNAPERNAPERNAPIYKERDTNKEKTNKEKKAKMNFGKPADAGKRKKSEKERINDWMDSQNAEKAEKAAVYEARRLRNEWKAANPEKTSEIEKKHRLRLESEKAEMAKAYRDRMIEHAVNAEISNIIKNS